MTQGREWIKVLCEMYKMFPHVSVTNLCLQDHGSLHLLLLLWAGGWRGKDLLHFFFTRASSSQNCLAIYSSGLWGRTPPPPPAYLRCWSIFSGPQYNHHEKRIQATGFGLKNREIQRSQKPPGLGLWIKCLNLNHIKSLPFLGQKWLNIGNFI